MGFITDIVGGYMQAEATEDAADTQAEATRSASAEQARQYDLTRADYAPYREAGQRALTQYEADIKSPFSGVDAMSDPGYQFGMQQGQSAIDRRVAAAGGRVSGAALKAAARYGTDYGSMKYGEAYQRRQDALNRLAALAGVGQTATGSVAAAGQNKTNAISGLISSQGDASAAAQMARGNIWGNTINSLSSRSGDMMDFFG